MDVRSMLYTSAKLVGDYRAVKNGRVVKRVRNRVVGKIASRTLWGKWFR